MNLAAIYTKTAEGLRIRKTLFGGLPGQLKRVIDLVDGHDSVQTIAEKLTDMPEQKVIAALTQLEKDGYIKYLAEATTEDDWELGTIFSPMVVEEVVVEEALDFPADLAPAQFAEIAEANRLEDERKAREIETQIRLREKAKADAEQQAKLEALRIAQEKAEKHKVEQEAREEAEKERIQLALEEKARIEAQKKEAEKARIAAELQAELEAEKNARQEAQRLAKEAEENRIKAEQEASLKAAELRIAEELRLKQEAEEKVRLETERAALEAEENQRKAEETLKKAEIEAQALVERIRAKEKARREQARQAREAQAAQKQAELEAKKAEEARLAAELKAQQAAQALAIAEAEARAIEEAKERGRLEAERIAREAEEAQRQLEIEAQVKAAEEARLAEELKLQQEAAAKKQAEEEARAVAEKLQVQQEAEARAQAKEAEKLEKARIAQEKAEEKARIKAQKEAERVAKKEQEAAKAAEKKAKKAAEKQAKAEAKRSVNFALEDEAEIISRAEIASMRRVARSSARLPKIKLPALNLKAWVKKLTKFSLVYLPIAALLLLGLMHVISLNMLNKPMEDIATASLGLPVKVGDVRASVWPRPHFKLSQVTIGEDKNLTMTTVKVSPVISTMFGENKQLSSITIEGLSIDQHNAGLPLQVLDQASKYPQLNIQAVNFKQVKLTMREFELGEFDGDIRLDTARALAGIEMKNADKTLFIDIMPQSKHYNIVLTGKRWASPINEKLVVDELSARGTLADNQANFNQINGEIYGGKLTATAKINWADAWQISGSFNLSQANTADILKAFASTGSVVGKVNLNGQFNGRASTMQTLADAANLNANIDMDNGKINGVDIPHAIVTPTDKSLEGYHTAFDKLTGNVQVNNGQFHYSNLVLKGDKLQAQGRVDIDGEQNISGKVSANLTTSSRSFHELLELTGKVSNVKRK